MALMVKLDLPPELEARLRRQASDLDAEVRKAYALELFRQGRISHFELSEILGLDRFGTDAYLKEHGVFEGSLTMADLDADQQTLQRLLSEDR